MLPRHFLHTLELLLHFYVQMQASYRLRMDRRPMVRMQRLLLMRLLHPHPNRCRYCRRVGFVDEDWIYPLQTHVI